MIDLHVIAEAFDRMANCIDVTYDDHGRRECLVISCHLSDPHVDADRWLAGDCDERARLGLIAEAKLAAAIKENAFLFRPSKSQRDFAKEWRGKNKSYQREAWKRWRLSHLDARRAYQRSYYLRTKAKQDADNAERMKAYRFAHREEYNAKCRERNRLRRAAKAASAR